MRISSFTFNTLLVLPLVAAFAIPGEAKQPAPVTAPLFHPAPTAQATFGLLLDPHADAQLTIVLPGSPSDVR